MYIKEYLSAIAALIFQSCVIHAVGIAYPDPAGPGETPITQYGRRYK